MSPNRLNPAERTAAESDYEKKFNKSPTADGDAKHLKDQEASGGDATWKTNAKIKKKTDETPKKARFRFAGRHRGKLRQGSPFLFIIGFLIIGVGYTSVLAPNILMVNIKEMYTNDLADATIALNSYYWKLMNYKIGMSQCGDQKSIKCKLSTMSRAQKLAFEKYGFTVMGNKVTQDGRDTGNSNNSSQPESRFEVTALIPPAYQQTINNLKADGLSGLTSAISGGNIGNLSNKISNDVVNMSNQQMSSGVQGLMNLAPIASGDMLYLFAHLSSGNKALVYGVFNPITSFFMDTRFKEVLKTRYNLTKTLTVGGEDVPSVNQSFDSSVMDSTGGIDTAGRPDPLSGVSLGSLSNPISAAQMLAASSVLATNSNSYTQLECNWYSFAKAVTNDAQSAKAATIARFAMQYLKEADAIKAGQADMMPANVLSSNLAADVTGSYGGQNATDSPMYKSIVFGGPMIPSLYGLAFGLNTYDVIGALTPAWFGLMGSAAGLGAVTNAPGKLVEPIASLGSGDRDYCLSGETTQNKNTIKPGDSKSTRCIEAINGMALPGSQGLLSDATQVAGETCPQPHYDHPDNTYEGQNAMTPSTRIVEGQETPVVSSLFGLNTLAWANAESQLFTSQLKGEPASEALFAGTGQILGDMAMSRGMEPGNAVTMSVYLAQKDKVQKDQNDIARYNAQKSPFDPYNKFSFLGSIVHDLSPTYNSKTPLFSTLANFVSLVGSGVKQLNPSAGAIEYLQPDTFDPTRLNCPDADYISIGIMADTACNVRYAMGKQELAAQPDSVLNYMTQAHSDLYQDNINDLQKRQAQADAEGDQANVGRMLATAQAASKKSEIDPNTGRPNPGSEYEKFMDYCVNRQDPWGRSAVAVHRDYLPAAEEAKRKQDKNGELQGVSPADSGYPYQQTPGVPYASITEGASADQDWYTGKKCLDQSDELTNFRAYTMLCSVDGSLSGGIDCTDSDDADLSGYSDSFYTSNNINYMSWY